MVTTSDTSSPDDRLNARRKKSAGKFIGNPDEVDARPGTARTRHPLAIRTSVPRQVEAAVVVAVPEDVGVRAVVAKVPEQVGGSVRMGVSVAKPTLGPSL